MALYSTFYLNFRYLLIVDLFNYDFFFNFCIKVLVIMMIEHFEVPFSFVPLPNPSPDEWRQPLGKNIQERARREQMEQDLKCHAEFILWAVGVRKV